MITDTIAAFKSRRISKFLENGPFPSLRDDPEQVGPMGIPVIQDHLDHGASKEPMNSCLEWIYRYHDPSVL